MPVLFAVYVQMSFLSEFFPIYRILHLFIFYWRALKKTKKLWEILIRVRFFVARKEFDKIGRFAYGNGKLYENGA